MCKYSLRNYEYKLPKDHLHIQDYQKIAFTFYL